MNAKEIAARCPFPVRFTYLWQSSTWWWFAVRGPFWVAVARSTGQERTLGELRANQLARETLPGFLPRTDRGFCEVRGGGSPSAESSRDTGSAVINGETLFPDETPVSFRGGVWWLGNQASFAYPIGEGQGNWPHLRAIIAAR